MTGALTALPRTQLAEVAPNWNAMKTAILECERLDEVKKLSDKAIALRAYFAQSKDVDNEVAAMRIRLRAERRLGELITYEQEAGRLDAGRGGDRKSPSAPTSVKLKDHGIPHDRSARAKKLADVSDADFEAALANGKPSSRGLAKLAKEKDKPEQARREPKIDVKPVLRTWGDIRDFCSAIEDGDLLDPQGWTKHPAIQEFQIREIRKAIPTIVTYLSRLAIEE